MSKKKPSKKYDATEGPGAHLTLVQTRFCIETDDGEYSRNHYVKLGGGPSITVNGSEIIFSSGVSIDVPGEIKKVEEWRHGLGGGWVQIWPLPATNRDARVELTLYRINTQKGVAGRYEYNTRKVMLREVTWKKKDAVDLHARVLSYVANECDGWTLKVYEEWKAD